MTVEYRNNASSKLSASISNVATSLSVTSGHGSRFPSFSGNIWFYVTLINSAGQNEIVKVTGREGDTMTIQRAQDGTTALAFSVDDVVELRITKAMLDDFKVDTRFGLLTTSAAAATYQPLGSYLTSETDPVFVASAAYGITSTDISNWNAAASAGSNYQTLDDDLTAIAALAGTSGLLKKTAANTWTLDTATYLTGIDSTAVVNALGYIPISDDMALGYFLPKAGPAEFTGTLTIAGNLLLGANSGSNRVIGFSGGTNTTLVLQAGAASGSGANIELTSDKYAYVDADETRLRSNDAGTVFATINSAGLNVNTGALKQGGNQVLHAGNYTSYSPSLTGSGASGSWGINVTGSAGSVAWGNVSGRPTAVSSFTNDANYIDLSTASAYFVPQLGGGVYSIDISGVAASASKLNTRTSVIATGTSITMNCNTTDIATQDNIELAGTLTINAPTGTPVNGQKLMLRLTSLYVQTFAWNAAFLGSTDSALPTASSGSSKEDYMGFIYDSTAAKWHLLAKNFGF